MRQCLSDSFARLIKVSAGQGKSLFRRRGFAGGLVAALWLSVVVTGMGVMAHYANSPGSTGVVPANWPAESAIRLETNRPTLIMFAHPRCPCTRASLGELERLMADCQGQFGAQVWFIKPAGTDENWTNTDLWRKAGAIPGVTVHSDNAGRETSRFGAGTSGQTVLFDPAGHLMFQGGMTISRGHAGDNPGRSALEALLQHRSTEQVQSPVFGCPLFETTYQQGQGGATCKR